MRCLAAAAYGSEVGFCRRCLKLPAPGLPCLAAFLLHSLYSVCSSEYHHRVALGDQACSGRADKQDSAAAMPSLLLLLLMLMLMLLMPTPPPCLLPLLHGFAC